MPAACRSNSRTSSSASSSIAACPATGRENWRAGRARNRGAFDRDLQRYLVVPISRLRGVSPNSSASPIVDGPCHVHRRRGISRTGRSCCAPPMTVMPIALRRYPRALRSCCLADGNRLEGEDSSCPPTAMLCRQDAQTNSRSAFTCIRRSAPIGSPTAMAPCCCCRIRTCGTSHATRMIVEIEESVYLAGHDGPRRTTQIVSTAVPAT